jgi:hypothetical protein
MQQSRFAPGSDAKAIDISAHGAGQHHAGRVVAAEHDRPFNRAGGDNRPFGDDPPGALTRLMQRRGRHMIGDALHGAVDAVIIDSKYCGAPHDANVGKAFELRDGLRNPLRGREAIDLASLRQKPSAELEIVVAEDDARAGATRCEGGGKSGRSAANHQEVAKGEGLFIGVGVFGIGGAAKPRGAAYRGLVQPLPETRRPHEGLVVEARRQSGSEQRIDRQKIEVERRPAVLARRLQPIVEFGDGGAGVRLASRAAAKLDKSVRLLGAGRQQSARTMIFERSPDEAHAIGEQRGSQRVAAKSGQGLAVKPERQGRVAIDEADLGKPERLRCARHGGHLWTTGLAGSADSIRCVLVSRVTMIQARQPVL